MNVTELARRLRISVTDLHNVFDRLGVDVGRKAIKVDDQVALRVMRQVREDPVIIREVLETKRQAQEELERKAAEAHAPKHLKLPAFITVRDFAQALERPVSQVIAELMKNGILATLNEQIDFETASIIAQDFGCTTERLATGAEDVSKTEALSLLLKDEEAQLQPRAPVVVVIGHVDHGKTTLLDAIRKSEVVASESGGITQHIGAYQVTHKGRPITFIDTPGHEAFTAMRSRGANVADMAILVVAANEGVMPQTKEAYAIIDKAKLPFVVALTKVDDPSVDVERAKKSLAEMNLLPEDWGGKVVTVPVSGKTKQGLSEFLDTILLLADLEKDRIRANPERRAVGTIIESHVGPGEGPVATVIVQTGTLRKGDVMKVGSVGGRVRLLRDFQGRPLAAAEPSMPAQIIGLKAVPEVGDILEVLEDFRELRKVVKKKATPIAATPFRLTPSEEEEEAEGPATLPLIVKADKLGSLEAILESLAKIHHEEVGVTIVGSGLGNISETDIFQAEASKADIFGFQVRITPQVVALVKTKGVTVKRFSVIYDLFEEVRKRLAELLKPKVMITELGALNVLAVFRKISKGMIVGGRVERGKIATGEKVRIIRAGKQLGEGKLVELQTNKVKVDEVAAGRECGLNVETKTTMLEGDVLEAFHEEFMKRELEEQVVKP